MNIKRRPYKTAAFGTVSILLVASVGVIVVAKVPPTIEPNCFVANIPVGGLTVAEAEKKIRVWWETEKRLPRSLDLRGKPTGHPPMTATSLDVTLDDVTTISKLPQRDILQTGEALIQQNTPARQNFSPTYKSIGVDLTGLSKWVSSQLTGKRPAKIGWVNHQIILKPEFAGASLNVAALREAVANAIQKEADVDLPLTTAEKHVSDADLAQITDLVSSFTTHFPVRAGSRNNNIRVAAGKLSGHILLPGERLSFNTTVGRRTVNAGFKEAPVYKNGKHDVGVGGGICQVSTTLYNAALLGDLNIVRRQNHSMPVGYVKLGRDATVDYGNIDLVIENPYSTPIGITSAYQSGTLTFRVFGKANDGMSIKIERKNQKDWDQPTEFVTDSHLAPGRTVVRERGSRGHQIYTYRLVYKNGALIKKEPLGRSFYKASPRIVARGPVSPQPPTFSPNRTRPQIPTSQPSAHF